MISSGPVRPGLSPNYLPRLGMNIGPRHHLCIQLAWCTHRSLRIADEIDNNGTIREQLWIDLLLVLIVGSNTGDKRSRSYHVALNEIAT